MNSIYTVLVRPVVTEKSMQAQAQRKYTFIVAGSATKVDIQNAVESMYSTEVEAVNIIPVRKKIRLIGRSKIHTKRQAAVKAVVTLAAGKSIDVMKMHEAQEKKESAKKTEKKTSAKKEQ